MSENLEKIKSNLPIPIEQCIDIAYRSMTGEIVGVDDIAAYAQISTILAIRLITNPIFGQMVHHLTLANAKHSFDAIAFKSLLNIARYSQDEKNKINAIKTLSDIVGRNESKNIKSQPVAVNINIDQIVRNTKSIPFKGF